jgi:hypothetical protein
VERRGQEGSGEVHSSGFCVTSLGYFASSGVPVFVFLDGWPVVISQTKAGDTNLTPKQINIIPQLLCPYDISPPAASQTTIARRQPSRYSIRNCQAAPSIRCEKLTHRSQRACAEITNACHTAEMSPKASSTHTEMLPKDYEGRS